jgi:hypothetical protein
MLTDTKNFSKVFYPNKVFAPGDTVYYFDDKRNKVVKSKVRLVQLSEESVSYYVNGNNLCFTDLYKSPEEIYLILNNNIIDEENS